ncbi:MAG TPA: hypothetical protein V6D05_18025 [Stenomitos sp.]
MTLVQSATTVAPGAFRKSQCYYPRVLPLRAHPIVAHFFGLSNRDLAHRYRQRHPAVAPDALEGILAYRSTYLAWAGSDLLHAIGQDGRPTMVVIETNSCPSGQKSMPALPFDHPSGGYRRLCETLWPGDPPEGGWAVVYDKNPMEAWGYAMTLADYVGHEVHLAEIHEHAANPSVRFRDGVLEIREASGAWKAISVAMRYVTQRPWLQLPLATETCLRNPVIACLAGGRNKLMAHKAYQRLNQALAATGLCIRTPETVCDVPAADVPYWVEALGGQAVIKVPYSNAGQGIYIVTEPSDLGRFLSLSHRYELFIVQRLVAASPHASDGTDLIQIGTVANERDERYVFDLRMMVGSGPQGFRPLAAYARRARTPVERGLDGDAWRQYGTNLSYHDERGEWRTDDSRLIPLSEQEFETLGLDLDDLIEAYVQTVLATIAIDQLARALADPVAGIDLAAFAAMNDDPALLRELFRPFHD